MHTHNFDHIMALAESTTATELTAGSEIASCHQCSDELALQIRAITAMRSTASVTLSELESARINQNLKRAIGLMDHPATKAPARRGRLTTVATLGAAAAILATVVLAGNALENQRADGDSEDFLHAKGAPATTVVSSSAPTTTETSSAFETTGASDENELLQSPGLAEGPPVVITMDTTTSQLYAGVTEFKDLDKLRNIVIEESGNASSSLERLSTQHPSLDWSVQNTESACETVQPMAVSGTVRFFTIARGEIDNTDVIVIAYVTDPLESSVIIAHNASTCEIVLRAPRP